MVKDYSGLEALVLKLVEAILSRRRCLVEYRVPWRDKPSKFPYDPYRVALVHGGLYCIGKVPAYKNFTTLAVERILSLDTTGEGFTVAPSFDPERYEAEAFGVAWEEPMTVVVRFSADQAPYVREREWHPTQKIRTLRDGRVELSFRAGGSFEIIRWILSWGGAAEAIRPETFRKQLKAIHKTPLKRYERGRSGRAFSSAHARSVAQAGGQAR